MRARVVAGSEAVGELGWLGLGAGDTAVRAEVSGMRWTWACRDRMAVSAKIRSFRGDATAFLKRFILRLKLWWCTRSQWAHADLRYVERKVRTIRQSRPHAEPAGPFLPRTGRQLRPTLPGHSKRQHRLHLQVTGLSPQSSAVASLDGLHGPDCACAEDRGVDYVANYSSAAGPRRAFYLSD